MPGAEHLDRGPRGVEARPLEQQQRGPCLHLQAVRLGRGCRDGPHLPTTGDDRDGVLAAQQRVQRGVGELRRGERKGGRQPRVDERDRRARGRAEAAQGHDVAHPEGRLGGGVALRAERQDLGGHTVELGGESGHPLHEAVVLAARCDDAAAAPTAQHETLTGEGEERLPHDGAGDAEALGELGLGGQERSGGQRAVGDARPQHRAEL